LAQKYSRGNLGNSKKSGENRMDDVNGGCIDLVASIAKRAIKNWVAPVNVNGVVAE
jgi:hypothetical protein